MDLEPQLTKLGGSIPVPWVQDLAKQSHHQLPARYVRTDEDPTLIPETGSLPHVPIIDLEKLVPEDVEMERFHNACKEWGFFQLVNHGVSKELVEKVKLEIKKFFDLPMEEKKKFWQQPGDLQGFGQAFVVSEEQKLNWGDMFYMITLPKQLRKPYLLPMLPTSLREAMEAYSAELKKLEMKLLYLVAKAIGMDPKDMIELFEEGFQSMRMNYYPPCPWPERAIGINSHSDAVGLTILLQISEVEGLQIKKDENWIPVKPLPDAFVINIGDILEIVTNGTYPSIQHRATVNSEKERLSIATFYSPKLDGDFGPAPSLITPETPARFRRIGVADYFKGFYARELKGKSYVDVMRIQNQQHDSEDECRKLINVNTREINAAP